MLALPIRFGGLGIFGPRKSSDQFSVSVTSPLAAAIINQLSSFDCTIFHHQQRSQARGTFHQV